MRVLLFTGKGGVGKTTIAAGTAALAARRGVKTLLLSTDGAHSLTDALAAPSETAPSKSADEPAEVGPGLFLHQTDPRRRAERAWRDIQNYLLALLDASGADPIAAEELTLLPGAAELLALLELRDHVRTGRFDLVVVDCAPTAESLRLLALPEALRWYVDRLLPPERRVQRALRPLLAGHRRAAGLPIPDDRVLEAAQRLEADLGEVRDVLTDAGTSVRLVLTPEAVVVAEARRTLTSLALHGYRVDAAVVNRVFPVEEADGWRAGWVRAQAMQLADVESSFAPLPVYRAPYCSGEPVGAESLTELARRLYAGKDPIGEPPDAEPMRVERAGGDFVLSLRLPFAQRSELDLARSGDELVVTAGTQRRIIALPAALRRCTVTGAALHGDYLRIGFAPDPALWRTP